MATKTYKPGDTWQGGFATFSPFSGAAKVADALPTAVLNHNGSDDATVTITVALIGGNRYRYSLVIPSTYAAGDECEVWITAAVDGVNGTAIAQGGSARLVAYNATDAAGLGLTNLDAKVSTRSTYAGGIGVAGGSITTLTIDGGSGPLAGAQVWVSTDAAGLTVIAGVLTANSSGQVQVLLIPGATYYLFAECPGQNPIVGKSFVAVAG